MFYVSHYHNTSIIREVIWLEYSVKYNTLSSSLLYTMNYVMER